MNEIFINNSVQVLDKNDTEIKLIYELVDIILGDTFYNEEFINILKKHKKFYKTIKTNEKFNSFLIEISTNQDIFNINIDEQKKHKLQIFIKYIDLFYPLFGQKTPEIISYYLRIIISEIINKNEYSNIKIITPISLIKIYQNIHGDLVINRNMLNQKKQSDMFYQGIDENFMDIDETKDIGLSIYQRPVNFFNILLIYLYKNNISIDKNLINTIGKIPFTTDALDNNIFLQADFKYELNNTDDFRSIIKFNPNSKIYYEIFFKENGIVFEPMNEKREKIQGSFTIFREEIEFLLNGLLKLPGRSYSDMIACLKIFFEEKTKNQI